MPPIGVDRRTSDWQFHSLLTELSQQHVCEEYKAVISSTINGAADSTAGFIPYDREVVNILSLTEKNEC